MTVNECREKMKNLCNECNVHENCEENCEFPIINKALDLLELKEQNRIIELPVSIGSKVYRIYNGEVEGLYFAKEDIVDILMWWNIRIFATKEKAEKRLEELRGE